MPSEKSEFRRGYNFKKKYLGKDKFRSFYVNEYGDVIGYTVSGSKQIVGRLEDQRYTKGFYGGVKKATMEALRERPTRRQPQYEPKPISYKPKEYKLSW